MTQTRSNPRIARRGVAAALAALLGAGVFGLSAPAAAADGRYYRMPDGSVQYVRDRDLPDWRRWPPEQQDYALSLAAHVLSQANSSNQPGLQEACAELENMISIVKIASDKYPIDMFQISLL